MRMSSQRKGPALALRLALTTTTPRPLYRWKAETVSFLYVSLVLGVNMSSLLSKSCQNYNIMFNG